MSRFDEICLWIAAALCALWVTNANADTYRVMVLDTGVDLSHEEISSHVKEPMSHNYVDNNSHGTAVAGLVLKDVCEEIELISCKYLEPGNPYMYGWQSLLSCLKEAAQRNVTWVNFSGNGDEPLEDEEKAIKALKDKGIIFVTAAGNHGLDLGTKLPCQGSFPACYNLSNIYPVGSLKKDGLATDSTNIGGFPNFRWEIGDDVITTAPKKKWIHFSGTSAAAAIYTNSLLKRKCWELKK